MSVSQAPVVFLLARFAGRGHQALNAHVGGDSAVVLVDVGRVEIERGELGALAAECVDLYGGVRIVERSVDGIAIGHGLFELRDQVGFGGGRLFDVGFLLFLFDLLL